MLSIGADSLRGWVLQANGRWDRFRESEKARESASKRRTAILVMILSALFVASSFGFSSWLCNDAIYHCSSEPQSGGPPCDDIPQHNCQASFSLALISLVIAAAASILALADFVRSRGPRESA